MKSITRGAFASAVVILALLVPGFAQQDAVMKAMQDEMARSMSQLQSPGMQKPYFIAYHVQDVDHINISATLGSLTSGTPTRARVMEVEVRVGDYALDNSNYFSVRNFSGARMYSGLAQAPLDDNYLQVRRQLWRTTDSQYKKAIEDLSAKRAALNAQKRTDNTPDFSKAKTATSQESPLHLNADMASLEQLTRDLSAVFKTNPDVITSSVQIDLRNTYTRYLNSEGSSFTRTDPQLKLTIQADAQSDDGLPLHDSIQLYGKVPQDLPAREQLLAQTRAMSERIQKMRQASTVERYNGPVLFEDSAAAEIFAQVFAPGLVTSRTPVADDPRFAMVFTQMMARMGLTDTFVDKIGGRVLPDSVQVVNNPKIDEYKKLKLLGAYTIDDDAVMSQEVPLVQNGILKTLLATRVPVQAVAESTGSRRGFGAAPGNLIFTSDKTSTQEELRQELLRQVKQRGLEYGIVIRHVGYNGANSLLRAAAMMAASPQAGSTTGLAEVFKIFPDGHEEPVRGLELADFNASAFRDIVAVGAQPFVYDEEFMPKLTSIFSMGMGGAGADLPVVSFVVPSLLFEEVSLSKAEGPFPNPPLTKSPIAAGQ